MNYRNALCRTQGAMGVIRAVDASDRGFCINAQVSHCKCTSVFMAVCVICLGCRPCAGHVNTAQVQQDGHPDLYFRVIAGTALARGFGFHISYLAFTERTEKRCPHSNRLGTRAVTGTCLQLLAEPVNGAGNSGGGAGNSVLVQTWSI